jgi:rhamnosyltransferase
MANGVCAIIVTYRIGQAVRRCFEAVRGQVQEVVFVDNGGDTETADALREIEKTHPNVRVFYNRENAGIAAAMNTGVRYALQKQYRWVLTLDHDSEAAEGMVDELIAAYHQLSDTTAHKVAIVAARMIDRNVPSPTLPVQGDAVREVDTCISSGCLIACDVFAEVDLFDEWLFLYYVDDDFCLRCKDNGWRVYLCGTAPLLHSEGRREKKVFMGRLFIYRNYGPPARYYMSRNAIYMLKHHLRHGRYCLRVLHRLCSDAVTTLLFADRRGPLVWSMLKGFAHGLIGK